MRWSCGWLASDGGVEQEETPSDGSWTVSKPPCQEGVFGCSSVGARGQILRCRGSRWFASWHGGPGGPAQLLSCPDPVLGRHKVTEPQKTCWQKVVKYGWWLLLQLVKFCLLDTFVTTGWREPVVPIVLIQANLNCDGNAVLLQGEIAEESSLGWNHVGQQVSTKSALSLIIRRR